MSISYSNLEYYAYLVYKTPFYIRPVPTDEKVQRSGHVGGLICQLMRYFLSELLSDSALGAS